MTTAAKKAAKRRAARSAALPFDLEAARRFVLAKLPGGTVNGKFGGASFYVGGKVFAFTRPKGLVMKLPAETIATLIATREAQHLTMGKRTMREWVLLPLATTGDFAAELPLLRKAMKFVLSRE